MKRVLEIRQRRQNQFIKNRLSTDKQRQLVDDQRVVQTGNINIILASESCLFLVGLDFIMAPGTEKRKEVEKVLEKNNKTMDVDA